MVQYLGRRNLSSGDIGKQQGKHEGWLFVVRGHNSIICWNVELAFHRSSHCWSIMFLEMLFMFGSVLRQGVLVLDFCQFQAIRWKQAMKPRLR